MLRLTPNRSAAEPGSHHTLGGLVADAVSDVGECGLRCERIRDEIVVGEDHQIVAIEALDIFELRLNDDRLKRKVGLGSLPRKAAFWRQQFR